MEQLFDEKMKEAEEAQMKLIRQARDT